jgi:hypothetical protein
MSDDDDISVPDAYPLLRQLLAASPHPPCWWFSCMGTDYSDHAAPTVDGWAGWPNVLEGILALLAKPRVDIHLNAPVMSVTVSGFGWSFTVSGQWLPDEQVLKWWGGETILGGINFGEVVGGQDLEALPELHPLLDEAMPEWLAWLQANAT